MGVRVAARTNAYESGRTVTNEPWHIHATVHLPVGWLPTGDAPAPQAENLGMRTLLVVGVVTWLGALLVAAMVAGVRDIDDPVEGISQRHLWLLGILAWPVLLVGGTALAWWLFPFDSVCHTGATNPYAEINCGLGWGAVLAVVAVVVASLAVRLFVESVHTRQEKARRIRDSEVPGRS